MTSKSLLLTAVLALCAAGCGDFERGETVPERGSTGVPSPVTDGTTPPPDGGGSSFQQVHTALNAACAQCHGGGGKGAYKLSDNAAADYEGIRALVNTNAPAQSLLLTKGAGEGHGGGALWKPGDANYEQILAWIKNGANP